MNLYVGTSGYSYREWKGTFYPENLPPRQMLHFYGTCFRTVEINSTFNGTPKASVVEAWAKGCDRAHSNDYATFLGLLFPVPV
jgi:uncharacterized protein YecE (DUF72 family)